MDDWRSLDPGCPHLSRNLGVKKPIFPESGGWNRSVMESIPRELRFEVFRIVRGLLVTTFLLMNAGCCCVLSLGTGSGWIVRSSRRVLRRIQVHRPANRGRANAGTRRAFFGMPTDSRHLRWQNAFSFSFAAGRRSRRVS